jgi:uncharacterized protein (PEP-CTERM system associated)
LTSSDGVIYGASLQWAPSDRTNFSGVWEHRFFGSSYSVQLSHRLPRTALSASFARGLSTYPQNALSIPAGANVASFVDQAFATRLSDPAERALAVQQFLAQAGLPTTLATPVNIFATGILLQTTGSASAVLLGVRNSVAFSVLLHEERRDIGHRARSAPDPSVRPEQYAGRGGVSFSHRLTGLTNLTASASYASTRSNITTGAFANARSNNGYLTVGSQHADWTEDKRIARRRLHRYCHGDSNFDSSSSYSISAGLNHTF